MGNGLGYIVSFGVFVEDVSSLLAKRVKYLQVWHGNGNGSWMELVVRCAGVERGGTATSWVYLCIYYHCALK